MYIIIKANVLTFTHTLDTKGSSVSHSLKKGQGSGQKKGTFDA